MAKKEKAEEKSAGVSKEKEEEEVKTINKKDDDKCNKEHAEPDEDNRGGASDHDADNAEKAAEDDGPPSEEEQKTYHKLRKRMAKAGLALDPTESTAQEQTDGHTTTPGAVIGTPQHMLTPSSSVDGKRTQETPMGKSVNSDLMKSPLYVELSKQLAGFDETVKKFGSAMTSLEDRVTNMTKALETIEKMPLYKSPSTELNKDYNPQGEPGKSSVDHEVASGKIKFS
jgi:hypothetical protein